MESLPRINLFNFSTLFSGYRVVNTFLVFILFILLQGALGEQGEQGEPGDIGEAGPIVCKLFIYILFIPKFCI